MDESARLPGVIDRIPQEWGKHLRFDPGWDDLVAGLDARLTALDPNYVVLQAKEKFGGLRYYAESSEFPYAADSPFHVAIREAEALSFKTCETCGVQEDVTTERNPGSWWIRSLCPACRPDDVVDSAT